MYVDALCNEIKEKASSYTQYDVISVFFGGGTPSIMTGNDILKIMSVIKSEYSLVEDCEISMEVNPGTIGENETKLDAYKRAGINRLSIGLQSANDNELKMLGRIHDVDAFEDTYDKAILAGFKNLNVDLISGLPGQKVEDFKKSLEYVLNLEPQPKHISAYSLIIEEGTPFYDMYGEKCENEDDNAENNMDYTQIESELCSEDSDREIYKITKDILGKHGYHRYEISNYSKEGYECRHNKVYWQRGNYLGFGVGSSSLVENIRWKNQDDVYEYINANGMTSVIETEKLSIKEQMEEFMFLGLRMMKGVSEKDFRNYFGQGFPKEYKDIINKYVSMGLMRCVYEDGEKAIAVSTMNDDSRVMSVGSGGDIGVMSAGSGDDVGVMSAGSGDDIGVMSTCFECENIGVISTCFECEYIRVMLTDKGINVSNVIMAEFIF